MDSNTALTLQSTIKLQAKAIAIQAETIAELMQKVGLGMSFVLYIIIQTIRLMVWFILISQPCREIFFNHSRKIFFDMILYPVKTTMCI